MSKQETMEGVRLSDAQGESFVLFKMPWFLMTPDANAKAVFDELSSDFQFPFALCYQQEDGDWMACGPDNLTLEMEGVDFSGLRWQAIPVIRFRR